jgi:hypothetical protein
VSKLGFPSLLWRLNICLSRRIVSENTKVANEGMGITGGQALMGGEGKKAKAPLWALMLMLVI